MQTQGRKPDVEVDNTWETQVRLFLDARRIFEISVLGRVGEKSTCLPSKCDLVLCVLNFWGEEEDLGADRQRGDCRRPIFPLFVKPIRTRGSA